MVSRLFHWIIDPPHPTPNFSCDLLTTHHELCFDPTSRISKRTTPPPRMMIFLGGADGALIRRAELDTLFRILLRETCGQVPPGGFLSTGPPGYTREPTPNAEWYPFSDTTPKNG